MNTLSPFLAARSNNIPARIFHAASPRWGLCLLALLAAFFCQLGVARALTPSLVGSVFNQGATSNIVINGNYAYSANGAEGLGIVNISNRAAPTVALHKLTSGRVQWVDVIGSYAYLAVSGDGLVVVNISNPNAPALVSIAPVAIANYVKIVGDTAFVGDAGTSLRLYSISNPAAPVLLGSHALPGSDVSGLEVRGNHAYLAVPGVGYQILDISNRALPVLAGTIPSAGSAEDIAISGNFAYLADGSAGLRIFILTNPVAPAFVGSYAPGDGIGRIAVEDGYAYAGSFGSLLNAQLKILDVDTPGNITLLGTYGGTETGPFYNVKDVAVQSGYVYVSDLLRGFNVVNPNLPSPYPLDPAWFGNYDASMWPIIKHERYGFMKYISTTPNGTHRIYIYNSKITYFTTTARTFPTINGTAKSKYKKDLPSGKMQIGLRGGKRAFYSSKKKKWVKDL